MGESYDSGESSSSHRVTTMPLGGVNGDQTNPLYQTLLQQTMKQPQGSNYGIGNMIAQLLGSYMLSSGGPGASWSTGLLNDSYSMGGGD